MVPVTILLPHTTEIMLLASIDNPCLISHYTVKVSQATIKFGKTRKSVKGKVDKDVEKQEVLCTTGESII